VTLSTITSFAIALVVGAHLIRWSRREQAAAPANLTPRERRANLIRNLGYISVTIGILAVFAYMTSDGLGPKWVHTASLPASIAFIIGGYVLAFVAAAIKTGAGPR